MVGYSVVMDYVVVVIDVVAGGVGYVGVVDV